MLNRNEMYGTTNVLETRIDKFGRNKSPRYTMYL